VGFAAAAGAGGLLAYGRWVEPGALTFTRHVLRLSPRGALDAPGEEAPRGGRLRIVQLSDLHLKDLGDVHERLAAGVDALEPDLLAFTGDTLDDWRNLPLLDAFLRLFRTGARKLAVMGNWEYQGGVTPDALARAFEGHGGELLVNRSVRFSARAGAVLVSGLDDWLRGRPDLAAAVAGAPEELLRRGHHLVMAHCPAQRDELASGSAAGAPLPWMLSGHTHGGQIGLPGLRVTPSGSGGYVRGWYRASTPSLYVSRGIGTSVVPIRIGSRPEVAVFDVQLA
jgi:predicted MPP superfamily phosphohydrolase